MEASPQRVLLLLIGAAECCGAVRVDLFDNSGLAGAPISSYDFPTLELSFALPPTAFSAEISTQLALPTAPAYYAVDCSRTFDDQISVGFVWFDDHLVCSKGAYANPPGSYDGSTDFPIYRRPGVMRAATVRANLYSVNVTTSATSAFSLFWCIMAAPAPTGSCSFVPVPAGQLAPGVSPAEAQRRELQRALAVGWGLWLHESVTAAVLLPAGLKLSLVLCHLGDGCLLSAIMDDGDVRVGLHAHDRSIAQMFLTYAGANVSVSVLGGFESLQVLVEPVSCGGGLDCSAYAFVLTGTFIWGRLGAVSSDKDSLTAAPLGLPAVELLAAASGPVQPVDPAKLEVNVTMLPYLAVSLSAGAVAFSTAGVPTVAAVRAAVAVAAALEAARYARFGELAETAQGVQAAISWNAIYTPAEAGPFPPVSRAWSSDSPAPGDSDPDQFSYVVFGWDNQLGALLAGLTSRELAYSSIIVSVKSKAAAGFIPNFGGGGAKSVDRTEPPLSGRVLLALYHKYGDTWLIDLLLDDLIDGIDWFRRERRLLPLGLIALGSSPVTSYAPPAWLGVNQMQGARYESGLDNSPMYDGPPDYFDNVSHLMLAYDVGMSSLFVAEAAALAELARIVNRTADAATLEAHATEVRGLIASRLWDEDAGIFKNFITANDTLSKRVSPTSFYALLARAATDDQAGRMATEWALNASRFCLSLSWPAGLAPDCFHGLPSISADDAAFHALGYWRGFIWGPMAQIVWWSFKNYLHVPAVAAARAALARQHNQMFLEQWRLNRHVCENFSPKRNATECTGSLFYHWGALSGMLALEEAGLY